MTVEPDSPVSNQCCELNPGPWNMLAAMLPTANWTADAEAERATRAVATPGADVDDSLARALFRRERRHVLLTGDKGVGKTAVVRELARRAAAGASYSSSCLVFSYSTDRRSFRGRGTRRSTSTKRQYVLLTLDTRYGIHKL